MTLRPEVPELTVELVREEVLRLLEHAPDGESLDDVTHALVELAVRACATTLDIDGTRVHLDKALEAGATPEQVQETFVLLSGIGIHILLACSQVLADRLAAIGGDYSAPLSPTQLALHAELVGDGVREARTSQVAPGFSENLLRLSPEETIRAIYAFRAVPWAGTALSMLQKELIGISVDSMPSHRFLPTLRLHVENAVSLGAGQREITEVLDIAAAAPPHRGLW